VRREAHGARVAAIGAVERSEHARPGGDVADERADEGGRRRRPPVRRLPLRRRLRGRARRRCCCRLHLVDASCAVALGLARAALRVNVVNVPRPAGRQEGRLWLFGGRRGRRHITAEDRGRARLCSIDLVRLCSSKVGAAVGGAGLASRARAVHVG
jgi:hypothetical protein